MHARPEIRDASGRGTAGRDAPSSVGRYELLFEIASGGMATVYLARSRGMGGFERVVALKRCHPELRRDAEFTTMFLDEARLAAAIHHPNVVATLEVDDDGASLYQVMEYVEGDRLSDLVRAARARGRAIPADVALGILCHVLGGLHAAHELRGHDGRLLDLVHRDVSLQNVMVGADGITRLIDFGIAKVANAASVTREGKIRGKLGYLAPEQLEARTVSRRVDVYAAGVVLWEVLTSQRLFRGVTESETIARVLQGVVAPPSSVRADLPRELDAVVLRAIARDAAARFATAAEFAAALEALPVPVAAPRAVAAFVDEMLGETIRRRRDLLASLRARAPTESARPERTLIQRAPWWFEPRADDALAAPAEPPPELSGDATAPSHALPAPLEPGTSSPPTPAPAAPPRRRGRALAMGGVVALAALAFGLALRLRSPHPATARTSTAVPVPLAPHDAPLPPPSVSLTAAPLPGPSATALPDRDRGADTLVARPAGAAAVATAPPRGTARRDRPAARTPRRHRAPSPASAARPARGERYLPPAP